MPVLHSRRLSRREFVKALTGVGAALSVGAFSRARAEGPAARRVIFFYFPDGIPGRSSDGEPSLWHPSGSETGFTLPSVLSPLEPYRDSCIFTAGLSMGATDVGSHPGGAKKLLTAVDGGNGESLDHVLARTVGASSLVRHLYLGAMGTQNNASGDKHISYVSPGVTIPPEDNPVVAFQRLFGTGGSGGGGSTTSPTGPDPEAVSVIDGVLADVHELRGRLGAVEQKRLDQHLESVREIEKRIKAVSPDLPPPADCKNPALSAGVDVSRLQDAAKFPEHLKAQIDLMVLAMACGLTKVGVLQCSHHTSDLAMSRFANAPMFNPSSDMRSHQASHYGPRHDFGHREFKDFVAQRKWFVEQFAYLLAALKARPEGSGTMLDHSVLLLCTEVSDGNTHSHDEMGFIVAGRGGGTLRTGRFLSQGYRRHGELLAGIARAMGSTMSGFGQESWGPLPGMLA